MFSIDINLLWHLPQIYDASFVISVDNKLEEHIIEIGIPSNDFSGRVSKIL